MQKIEVYLSEIAKSTIGADGVDGAVLKRRLAKRNFVIGRRLAMDEPLASRLREVVRGEIVAELAMDAGPVDVVAPGYVALEFVVRIGHSERESRVGCPENQLKTVPL